jgi:hypothetical protein
MPYCRTFLSVAFLCVVAHASALAQQPTPQDFYGFLPFHRALSHQITTRAAARLASAERLAHTAIARYGVSHDDFTRISVSIEPVLGRLTAIPEEALAHKATAGAYPTVTILQAFYSRRLAVLFHSMTTLRNTLSPASWADLTVYINSTLRRQNVTSTSTLNRHVLFRRLNVIAYAGYGEEAVNQRHDASQNVGTGLYGFSNIVTYLPDSACAAINPLNNSESLGVSRFYISGLNGIWWLGGGSEPADEYYNQGALTANKNCGASDICNEASYWTVTLDFQKLSLSYSVCNFMVSLSHPTEA